MWNFRCASTEIDKIIHKVVETFTSGISRFHIYKAPGINLKKINIDQEENSKWGKVTKKQRKQM